jgi:hypothetical protein
MIAPLTGGVLVRYKHFLVAVALMVAVGCEPPTAFVYRPNPVSRVIDAPKDKAWSIIDAHVGLLNPIQSLEKDSGIISTQRMTLTPAQLFAWAGEDSWEYVRSLSGIYGVRDGGGWQHSGTIIITVLAVEVEPDKTKVTVACKFDARWNDRPSSNVNSRGTLEQELLDGIEKALNPSFVPESLSVDAIIEKRMQERPKPTQTIFQVVD